MVASWPGGATDSASRVARCDAAAHRSAICRHQSAVVLHAAAREASGDLASDSPAMPRPTTVENDAARWRAITRAVEAHERTDARWLEYELDAAKLLDFPVMTDMREPAHDGISQGQATSRLSQAVAGGRSSRRPGRRGPLSRCGSGLCDRVRHRGGRGDAQTQNRLFPRGTAAAGKSAKPAAGGIRRRRDGPGTRARISFGAHRTRRTHRVAGPYAGRHRAGIAGELDD